MPARKKPSRRPDARRGDHATPTSARTSRPPSCRTSSTPEIEQPMPRCATRATRRSTRSSSGRARTSRTRDDLEVAGVADLHPGEDRPAGAHREPARHRAQAGEHEPELTLFDDFDGLDELGPRRLLPARGELVEPHDPRRLAASDDQPGREGRRCRGKVQMIYLDPPYGIKFGSQLAGLHAQARREGRQGRGRHPPARADQGVPRHLGARHPLVPGLPARPARRSPASCSPRRGSIFVQIGDENVHLVRAVMDEVFGSENFVSHDHVQERPSWSHGGRTCSAPSRLSSSGTRRTSSAVKYRQLYHDEGARRDRRRDAYRLRRC